MTQKKQEENALTHQEKILRLKRSLATSFRSHLGELLYSDDIFTMDKISVNFKTGKVLCYGHFKEQKQEEIIQSSDDPTNDITEDQPEKDTENESSVPEREDEIPTPNTEEQTGLPLDKSIPQQTDREKEDNPKVVEQPEDTEEDVNLFHTQLPAHDTEAESYTVNDLRDWILGYGTYNDTQAEERLEALKVSVFENRKSRKPTFLFRDLEGYSSKHPALIKNLIKAALKKGWNS